MLCRNTPFPDGSVPENPVCKKTFLKFPNRGNRRNRLRYHLALW
jgi:hypothetical protein